MKTNNYSVRAIFESNTRCKKLTKQKEQRLREINKEMDMLNEERLEIIK